MRKKSKGVTLIELIIVMGLTLVVMSAAYSFLNTSNKSTTNQDLKSTLQSEGNIIENKILNIATQAKNAENIISEGIKLDNTKIINVDFDSNGNFDLTEITLIDYDGKTSVIKLEDNVLTINTNGEGTQILSKNIVEMKAQPLNINQLTEEEKKTKIITDMSGYKFSFKLGAKKGLIEAEYSISVQANFRNFEVELSKAKQEFNKFESAIANVWNKSQSLEKILDTRPEDILNANLSLYDSESGIEITEINLKQYDGSTVAIKLSGTKLTIGAKEFNNVIGFKIKVLDNNIQNNTLRNSNGFKILVTISEDNIDNPTEKIQSTYETIVKFKNS